MKPRARKRFTVDKVRASRDGHEYHEAWAACKSMQLLWPESELTAIAVEGLSPADQHHTSADASEIADITLYYGAPNFERASRTTIAQFKYSIANNAVEFRAANAKKTVTKFASAYKAFSQEFGAKAVRAKLDFELITNRPVYPPLLHAIDALAKDLPRRGEVATQANQFQVASGLSGKALTDFAGKCRFVGLKDDLARIKKELAGLVVDWSATNDPPAAARLGQLKQLVRDKAGSAGTHQNLVRRTDILAALDVGDEEELLPCKSALAEVGEVVDREQLDDALKRIKQLSVPLLIHASGGVGKTVFMTSLASALQNCSEVVFFDCFGGGAYRSPEDARHLPNRGLIHIANTLAFRGLCDPILPGGNDVQTLFRTFRKRLNQCVNTLKTITPGSELTLFIDAIDNAALIAQERGEEAFPISLLESIHQKPIPGLTLIVSCRTERKPSTHARYQEFELLPFGLEETGVYLRSRLKRVSQTEVKVAWARSGGNPRVLEYLLKSGRGVLDESEIDKSVALDDLIQQRITDALLAAIDRGYVQENIDAFLAGLAVLPPPVPLDEYAEAHGLTPSAVESFASDLRPLLERTNQGLMFRDEPTETLVRDRYASSLSVLRRVADNLLARQEVSVYAARALPGLLQKLDDGEQLFQLAFDDRIPASITSAVGKRSIRYARIRAAVLHAAIKRDYNRLVRLLIELSSIAAVDQRGANYILDYPDLVVAARDVDATRRLFEARTGWPGTRHARLAIANSLAGQSEEATRHAVKTQEWIDHFFQRKENDDITRPDDPCPEKQDIAAIPFFLLCEGRADHAVNVLRRWRDWFSYEFCEYVFQYLHLAVTIRGISPRILEKFVDSLTAVGPLAAALSFNEFTPTRTKGLVVKLARACKRMKQLSMSDSFHRDRSYDLRDGLCQAVAVALSYGLRTEALTIASRAPGGRPSLWSLRDRLYPGDDLFPSVFQAALVAGAKNRSVHEKDLVPNELVPICSRINKRTIGKEFGEQVRAKLPRITRREPIAVGERPEPGILTPAQAEQAGRFLSSLQPLVRVTQALADILVAPRRSIDRKFSVLLKIWEETRKNSDPYETREFDNVFSSLGFTAAFFVLRARSDLKPSSVERFLATAHSQGMGAGDLVPIIATLAQRTPLHELAGQQAIKARSLIEAEDDVTSRASLFASLGRAMLPTTIAEASVYFRDGLEQMDAIGSGDYEFTNELLLFASTMKGGELAESDFHTLTNICELNMGGDPEKFFWGAFAGGLSRAAGSRVLAKLSRWDDRSKIDLEHTLLPYLTALVANEKMEPEIALALNRLARPVEYWYHGTKEFAEAIRSKGGTGRQDIASELIQQYQDDYHGFFSDSTVEALAAIAKETLGKSSEVTAYLSAAYKRFASARDTQNDHVNYSGTSRSRSEVRRLKEMDRAKHQDREAIRSITRATDPIDHASLARAVKELYSLHHPYDSRREFFSLLQAKVPFRGRLEYVSNVCSVEDLNFYWKLEELKECKNSWRGSSAALGEVLRSQAKPLVQLHMDDLVSQGRLSGSRLREIAEITGVPITELVIELIQIFARSDISVSGAVWLAVASLLGGQATEGQCQLALTRLLRSEAAKLADSVVDGPWKPGLYPESDSQEIAAGLVWRMLGSPHTEGRWRAAHSLRCFARFGRWEVLASVVRRLHSEETAGPFQAGELTFFSLHARLWLLIALARIALDYPKEIARYADDLLRITTEDRNPHVLMRHFAARALLTCVDAGEVGLPSDVVSRLRRINLSPFERLKERLRKGGGFYDGRPRMSPKSPYEFRLDYEFRKNDVDNLAHVFGKSCWQLDDLMSEVVHALAPLATSMHDTGGRDLGYRTRYYGMAMAYHTYGQQLGWHALLIVAGKLLKESPVTDDWWYEDDPWGEWLSRYLLTREDGYWLSDGMDWLPLDTTAALLEKAKNGLVLTGDPDKLLQLVGITPRVGKELVIEGAWRSVDDVRVHISSALAPPDRAQRLARKLTREEPMGVWLPKYYEGEEGTEYLGTDRKSFTPWIFVPREAAKLDDRDPFGAPCANARPYIAPQVASAFSLASGDCFGSTWRDKHARMVERAEAWGRENKDREGGPYSGSRLLCSTSFIRTLLRAYNKDLLILISLQRDQREGQGSTQYSHTIAVVRISPKLEVEYFKGRMNHLHVWRY